MIIYAIFFCMQVSQSCRELSPAHIGRSGSLSAIYYSLKHCQTDMERFYGDVGSLKNGRVYMGKTMWYTCLGRHVNAWQQP